MQHHMSCDIYDPTTHGVSLPSQLWCVNDDGNLGEYPAWRSSCGYTWLELPNLADSIVYWESLMFSCPSYMVRKTMRLFEAGSDTTSSTLYGFVQAMLCFPDVQKRAQEEIDRVVGPDRLPTMDDEPNLQYIRGYIKETLRWMPTTIIGAVPHAVTQNDYYEG
jgi:hypothetical protein